MFIPIEYLHLSEVSVLDPRPPLKRVLGDTFQRWTFYSSFRTFLWSRVRGSVSLPHRLRFRDPVLSHTTRGLGSCLPLLTRPTPTCPSILERPLLLILIIRTFQSRLNFLLSFFRVSSIPWVSSTTLRLVPHDQFGYKKKDRGKVVPLSC